MQFITISSRSKDNFEYKHIYYSIIFLNSNSFHYIVSETQILNEKSSSSSLEILMKFSKDYSISFEKLIIIFNGFVHVLRLALKPPAAFLKPDVNQLKINIHSFLFC